MPLTGKRRKNAVRNKLKDAAKRPLPGRKPADDDEEITSSSSSDEEENAAEGVVRTAPQEEEEEAEDLETPQEKRLRLTKKYLEEIASMEEGKSMSLHDAVSSRLKEDVLEQAGRLRKALAHRIEGVESSAVLRAKEMRLAPTCLVLAPDNDSLFAAGKDGVIVKWSISSGQKLCCTPRGNRRRPHEGEEEGAEPQTHSSAVLCLDVSSDGRLLVSGDASAAILVLKKRPVFVVREAHGRNPSNGLPNWISSLAALHNSDLVASGSSDGVVRVWRHLEGAAGRSRLEPLLEHPLVGFVNCLRFLPHGGGLLCAVGQEHRLGRWWRDKKAKNSVCVLRFKLKE
ncbi:unnamed protein product [Cyprideis torosa]|uniref:Uncharacterized protein n=1 Tax=Cyprideis torosa TaxID=163714 RepID=A0A7R8ZQU8_9CRUS|nr:unnamed protein product [Cyprideis torosa]CAG0903785.1 unnamed protein product [Cyprideis torosa]